MAFNSSTLSNFNYSSMGLLPDTQNLWLRMRRECRERFPATNFKGNRQSGFPQKSQKKVPWFFHDFSRPKSKFPEKNTNICFCGPWIKLQNQLQTDTNAHPHTHTHIWFDQDQPTIQLILLVIQLIQEVKTTLVNLIKMGNRFSYKHLKNDIDFSFPYRLYT